MNREAMEQAAQYWEIIDSKSPHLRPEEVLADIEAYITANDTCALATGSGAHIRCTPIEYVYMDHVFYFFSEGGLKFRGMGENEHASVAVFDKFSGFHQLHSVQAFGTIAVLDEESAAYKKAVEKKGLRMDVLKKKNTVLHVIAFTPQRYDAIQAEWKDKQVSIRQTYIVEDNAAK